MGAAFRDLFRAKTFRSPHYIPIVADPGELAPLNAPGSEAGYRSIVPDELEADEGTWNRCAARILLQVGDYEPREYAEDVDCPAFVLQATRDRLVSADAVEDVVATLDDVERLRVDCGHFDPYTGDRFESAVRRQADFLERHLILTDENSDGFSTAS